MGAGESKFKNKYVSLSKEDEDAILASLSPSFLRESEILRSFIKDSHNQTKFGESDWRKLPEFWKLNPNNPNLRYTLWLDLEKKRAGKLRRFILKTFNGLGFLLKRLVTFGAYVTNFIIKVIWRVFWTYSLQLFFHHANQLGKKLFYGDKEKRAKHIVCLTLGILVAATALWLGWWVFPAVGAWLATTLYIPTFAAAFASTLGLVAGGLLIGMFIPDQIWKFVERRREKSGAGIKEDPENEERNKAIKNLHMIFTKKIHKHQFLNLDNPLKLDQLSYYKQLRDDFLPSAETMQINNFLHYKLDRMVFKIDKLEQQFKEMPTEHKVIMDDLIKRLDKEFRDIQDNQNLKKPESFNQMSNKAMKKAIKQYKEDEPYDYSRMDSLFFSSTEYYCKKTWKAETLYNNFFKGRIDSTSIRKHLGKIDKARERESFKSDLNIAVQEKIKKL